MVHPNFTIVFLGSGRCFHTMDWFRSCQSLVEKAPLFITDNYGREGFVPLLKSSDRVIELFVIDPLLPKKSSRLGHAWRNLLKLLLVPLQVYLLRRRLRHIPMPFLFAHSSYYAFVASFCGVRYSATPQGSEVLVRPDRSRFYRWFLSRSAKRASFVTVDSAAMAAGLKRIAGVSPHIVQNGINVTEIVATHSDEPRTLVTTMRGIDRNYRIAEIIAGRDASAPDVPLNLCFPFIEDGYFQEVKQLLRATDISLGRLPRERLYAELRKSICVISIPKSDSSPRSVYEAIFCGAAVICTPAAYITALPACMRARIIVVNLADPAWFSTALVRAREVSAAPYFPSPDALEAFDQRASMRKFLALAASAVAHPR